MGVTYETGSGIFRIRWDDDRRRVFLFWVHNYGARSVGYSLKYDGVEYSGTGHEYMYHKVARYKYPDRPIIIIGKDHPKTIDIETWEMPGKISTRTEYLDPGIPTSPNTIPTVDFRGFLGHVIKFGAKYVGGNAYNSPGFEVLYFEPAT